MLPPLDIPSKIAETPWQDLSLRTFHQIDPEPNFQSQYHQEYIAQPASSPLSLYPTNRDAQVQDENRIADQLTPAHIAPLVDLHIHFQDLPAFIHHPDFDHFAYCWMESQDHIELSKQVEYRPTALVWFTSSSVHMATIASHYPSFVPNEDPEASTVHIKAAYQRLAHYFNVMRKVIDTIEQGRLANRSPQEVILPIVNHLFEKSFSQQNQPSNIIHSQPPIFYHHDKLTYKSQMLPSFPGMPTSVPPSLNYSDTSTPQAQSLPLEFPPNHQHLQAHEYLSLSNPATPNSIDTLSTLFWTYPVSMEQQQQPDQSSCMSSFDSLSTLPADTTKSEEDNESMPATTSMQLDPYPNYQTHNLEYSTPEDLDSDYQHTSMEEDNDDDNDYEEDSDHSNNRQTKAKKKNRKDPVPNDSNIITTTATINSHQAERQNLPMGSKDKTTVTPRHNFPRRGRTATSYDEETTHFLKAMFFNIYSQRDKLTKDQRRQVVEKTGLKPRNVTYWFSNHKRRFQAALDVFKKLVAESNGRIQTYDDFVQWRRDNGLPEDITDNRT